MDIIANDVDKEEESVYAKLYGELESRDQSISLIVGTKQRTSKDKS